VFSSLVENGDIWSLPLDTNQGKVVGKPEQLTSYLAPDYHPSISADGKSVVFISKRSGNGDIWLKDLETGREAQITVTPSGESHPEISWDGLFVAYSTVTDELANEETYVIPSRGGIPQNVSRGCGPPWDWSPDGKYLISMCYPQGERRRQIGLFNLPDRKQTLLLDSPAASLYQGNFSSDGKWLTFNAAIPGSRLFIAPFRGESTIPEAQWIAVTDGTYWDDKPRWSPDGKLLYFTSDRDGFVCLWAQRLEPVTKKPIGPAFVIYHFHEARRSMLNAGYAHLEVSVARDKIVFNLGELTGNLWRAQLDLK
jgi:Tol biopolymer transport system component